MIARKRLWKIGLLGAVIVLCGWAAPANAGSIQGTGTTNFVGEFSTFLADFGTWNASHNNLPLLFLEVTPPQEQPEAFFLLWWLWMRSQGHGPSSPPSMAGGPPTSGPGGPGGPPMEPPIGTIGSGSNGNDPPPNSVPGNPPSIGTVGSGPNGNGPSLPILGGGSGPQGNGGNPPIFLPPLNLPPQTSGPDNLPSPGNDPSGGGLFWSDGGPVSPDIPSVPEPSTLALLSSGALGMLTYSWGRWRTARRGTGAR
jgi:hypothetical protein